MNKTLAQESSQLNQLVVLSSWETVLDLLVLELKEESVFQSSILKNKSFLNTFTLSDIREENSHLCAICSFLDKVL